MDHFSLQNRKWIWTAWHFIACLMVVFVAKRLLFYRTKPILLRLFLLAGLLSAIEWFVRSAGYFSGPVILGIFPFFILKVNNKNRCSNFQARDTQKSPNYEYLSPKIYFQISGLYLEHLVYSGNEYSYRRWRIFTAFIAGGNSIWTPRNCTSRWTHGVTPSRRVNLIVKRVKPTLKGLMVSLTVAAGDPSIRRRYS